LQFQLISIKKGYQTDSLLSKYNALARVI